MKDSGCVQLSKKALADIGICWTKQNENTGFTIGAIG